jgi:sugar phosphate isomerase/epimerase
LVKPDPALLAQVDGALRELGNRTDRYGVALALSSELSELAALERAIRHADCPWFGVDLDPLSLLRDAWEMDEAFSRLGPLVHHVRARDAIQGQGGRTQPTVIGQGSVDWPRLLHNLDEASYAGWLTIDPTDLPDRPAAATAAVKFLRGLL